MSDRTVENVRKDRVPKNTIRHTMWSTNVYNAWVKERNEQFKDFQAERNEFQRIPNLDSINLEEINEICCRSEEERWQRLQTRSTV